MPHARQSLFAALIVTTVVVSAALCWSGWRLLDQQQAIDEQQARRQLESSADAMTAGVRGKLAEAGERLSGWLSNPGISSLTVDKAVVVTLSPDEVIVTPRDGLPFVPATREGRGVPSDAFSKIEAAEFASPPRLALAADQYRLLTGDIDPQVRAGAWLRLGRVLRKSHQFREALAAYQHLAALGDVRTDDLPAELAALHGQRSAYLAMSDRGGERQVAHQLLNALDSGRWLLTRGTAEFYRDELRTAARPDSWRLAGALSDVWTEAGGHLSARGQRLVTADGTDVLVLWRSSGNRSALLAAFANNFFTWPASGGISWQLADPEGEVVGSETAGSDRPVTRIIGNSEYPWTLHVWAAPQPGAAGAGSRTILLTMMGATLVFVWGAAYFMSRAIRREAEVARLQSDFVAAVSHEFRSPLTTVRQMAEMLELERVPTEERRHKYYKIMSGEAARLQRLVETLLNFGRMEAGAERYHFADVDAATLVRGVVNDIEPQAREAGKYIDLSGPNASTRVRADESALALALRNLIDNAIKYSPSEPTVWVRWTKENDRAAISVVDRGVGIPRAEQQSIFQKFVRGRAAIDANVKGTGIGLSMVRQIVIAHGGEMRLESEPGEGSTFTMLLPALDSGEIRS